QLFLNVKPSWIYQQYQSTGRLMTLEYMKKYQVPPERIVIEITEEAFGGKLEHLNEIVDIYRRAGCTIAIDDVGSGFSNFDRIAMIHPQIMKLDLSLLKKSRNHQGYKAVMHSFSNIAEQLGASLLVEGVETKEDIRIA